MLGENFLKLCRCCMKNGGINIFSTLYESQPVSKILEQILSKRVFSDDLMPKTICHECFSKIVSQMLFLRNYNKVQEQLLQILKEQNDTSDKINDILENTSNDLAPGSNLDQKEEIGQTLLIPKNSDEVFTNLHSFETCCSTSDRKSVTDQSLDILNREELNNSCEGSNYDSESAPMVLEKDKSEIHKSNEDETSKFKSKHSCAECKESFEFLKQLNEHCKSFGHSLPKRYVCEICSKKFSTNSRLRDHINLHTKKKLFVCDECDMAFTLHSNLKRHKKRHTGEKSYFCEVCNKGFIQKHTFTVHMRVHNGETPYICELCCKGFRTKPLLQQHMHKHNDIEKYTIKYQRYYLKYGKMKVECEVCQKIMTKSALYNHMKIKHGDGIKKFLCNSCGKTYATKMSLEVHMNIHTKKIKYDCNICGKSFTHQNYLKTHLLLHSGERPHCCDLCGKTFVQRTHLDRHKRTHTGVRPYSCSYCNKSFALNENLKVHVRIHTKETPYCCSECGKGFFSSSSRKKHEINMHQVQQK